MMYPPGDPKISPRSVINTWTLTLSCLVGLQVASGGGKGGSPEDALLKQRLEEMEAEQRNAWEEKERLSR